MDCRSSTLISQGKVLFVGSHNNYFNLLFIVICVVLLLFGVFFFFVQKSSDTPILLNLNQMKATKKVIFGLCKEYVGVRKVAPPLQGYQVELYPVCEMIVREQRQHQIYLPTLDLMIKLDGRPFCGNVIWQLLYIYI